MVRAHKKAKLCWMVEFDSRKFSSQNGFEFVLIGKMLVDYLFW